MLPVVAGEEEHWRRTLQQLSGSRRVDLDLLRCRGGIGALRVWLQQTRWIAVAVVRVEVEDLAKAEAALMESEGAFGTWLRRKATELHRVDLSPARSERTSELVFDSNDPTLGAPDTNTGHR